jgi:hypothetical protein
MTLAGGSVMEVTSFRASFCADIFLEGSGYVISKGLMNATFGQHWDHMNSVMVDFQAYACCGDEVLARALYSTPGIQLTAPERISHNRFSGDRIQSLRFNEKTWCEPLMSLHHILPSTFSALHAFEQEVFPRLASDDYIRYFDVWHHFLPDWMRQADEQGVETVRTSWFNFSEDEKVDPIDGQAFDASFCQRACSEDNNCYQWHFRDNEEGRECKLGKEVLRFGEERQGFTSGFHLRRFGWLRHKMACERSLS